MWYLESGDLKGISYKEFIPEAFTDLYRTIEESTGHIPDIGKLAIASQTGFDYNEESIVFIPDTILDDDADLMEAQDTLDLILKKVDNNTRKILEIVREPRDRILSAEFIDAPNSRENVWDNEIEVPEDYKWPE